MRDAGDFIGFWVGTELCDYFDIVQDTVPYGSRARMMCYQSKVQEAGLYNVSEHVVAGWSQKSPSLRKASLSNIYYEHTVLPAISKVSSNQGSIHGQQLVISGTGFSNNKNNLTVKVGGVNCEVISSTTE